MECRKKKTSGWRGAWGEKNTQLDIDYSPSFNSERYFAEALPEMPLLPFSFPAKQFTPPFSHLKLNEVTPMGW